MLTENGNRLEWASLSSSRPPGTHHWQSLTRSNWPRKNICRADVWGQKCKEINHSSRDFSLSLGWNWDFWAYCKLELHTQNLIYTLLRRAFALAIVCVLDTFPQSCFFHFFQASVPVLLLDAVTPLPTMPFYHALFSPEIYISVSNKHVKLKYLSC